MTTIDTPPFPLEIWETIFEQCPAGTLTVLPRVCKGFNEILNSTSNLWESCANREFQGVMPAPGYTYKQLVTRMVFQNSTASQLCNKTGTRISQTLKVVSGFALVAAVMIGISTLETVAININAIPPIYTEYLGTIFGMAGVGIGILSTFGSDTRKKTIAQATAITIGLTLAFTLISIVGMEALEKLVVSGFTTEQRLQRTAIGCTSAGGAVIVGIAIGAIVSILGEKLMINCGEPVQRSCTKIAFKITRFVQKLCPWAS